MPKKTNHKSIISKAILIVFLGSFAISGSIQAQNPPAPNNYDPDTDLLVSDYVSAQNDQQSCSSFAQKVERASSSASDFYSAIWDDQIWSQLYPNEKCFIVKRHKGFDGSDSLSLSSGSPSPVASGEGVIAGAQVPAENVDKSKWTQAREIAIKLTALAITSNNPANFLTLFPEAGRVIKNTLETPFVILINGFGGGIMSLADLMLAAMGKTVDNLTTKTYKDAQGNFTKFPGVVLVGWVAVRDIMNIFFVLALIVISLATILRIEAYNWKKLLARLIIMALLVNFSKVIAESIVSFADLILNLFITNDSWSIGLGELASNTYGGRKYFEGFFTGDILAVAVGKLILACVSLVSFTALTVLFVIRLVGIWILIIFSPMAFALNILPATQQYAQMWWNYFIKYLIWAPVAAFMILLFGVVFKNDYYGLGGDALLRYLVMIVFVWGALTVAKQAGMVGGNLVVSAAQGALRKAGGFAMASLVGKKGDRFSGGLWGWSARKVGKRTGLALTPELWSKGWKAYSEKKRKEDYLDTIQTADSRKSEGKMFTSLASPEDFYRRVFNTETYTRGVEHIRHGRFNQNKWAFDEYHQLREQEQEISAHHTQEEIDQIRGEINQSRQIANVLSPSVLNQDLVEIDRSGDKVADAVVNAFKEIENTIKQMKDKGKTAEAARLEGDLEDIRTANTDPNSFTFDTNSAAGKMIKDKLAAVGQDNELDAEAKQLKVDNSRPITKQAKDEAWAALKKREAYLEQYRPPLNYEATLAEDSFVAEEKKKVQGKESSELQAHLNDGLKQGNRYKVQAVAEKMAEDANDNEMFNKTWVKGADGTLHNFESNFEGFKKFINEVMVGKLGMNRQSADRWAIKLGYINESKNHWETARVGEFKYGRAHMYKEEADHAKAALAELNKMSARDLMKLNRLGYGGEKEYSDGRREFSPSILGKAIARALGPIMANSNEMRHMDGNALYNILLRKKEFLDAGASPQFIKAAEAMSQGRPKDSNPSAVVDAITSLENTVRNNRNI